MTITYFPNSQITVPIKDEDIDHNNHLTYDRYLTYFKEAWFSQLATIGVCPKQLPSYNLGIVVLNADLEYKHEIPKGAFVKIRSLFLPVDNRSTFSMRHVMEYDQSIAAICTDKNAFVRVIDGKKRICHIPSEIFSKIERIVREVRK